MNTTSRFESPAGARAGELLGELPSTSGDERIEVWRRAGSDGEPQIELVEYHWGSGVGWYVQKSLTLDGAQAALLAGVLAAAETTSQAAPPNRAASPRPRPTARQDGNLVQLFFS